MKTHGTVSITAISQAQGVCVLDCSLEVSVPQSQIFQISQQPANFFHLSNNLQTKKDYV